MPFRPSYVWMNIVSCWRTILLRLKATKDHGCAASWEKLTYTFKRSLLSLVNKTVSYRKSMAGPIMMPLLYKTPAANGIVRTFSISAKSSQSSVRKIRPAPILTLHRYGVRPEEGKFTGAYVLGWRRNRSLGELSHSTYSLCNSSENLRFSGWIYHIHPKFPVVNTISL